MSSNVACVEFRTLTEDVDDEGDDGANSAGRSAGISAASSLNHATRVPTLLSYSSGPSRCFHNLKTFRMIKIVFMIIVLLLLIYLVNIPRKPSRSANGEKSPDKDDDSSSASHSEDPWKHLQYLEELVKRGRIRDLRDPSVVCPNTHNVYTHVGPPGKWTKCYFVSPKIVQMSFASAQNFCSKTGSKLLRLESESEAEFLTHVVPSGWTEFWLGAVQDEPPSDGRWVWDESNGTEVTVAQWSNRELFASGCVKYSIRSKVWVTINCENRVRFVCESRSTNPLITDNEEQSEDTGTRKCDGNRCYWLSDRQAPWITARSICASKEAFLVEVESPAENQWLFREGLEDFWMGASNVSGSWRWNDTANEVDVGFTDWQKRTSALTFPGNQCLYYSNAPHMAHQVRHWKSQSCYFWKRFICEFGRATSGNTSISEYVVPGFSHSNTIQKKLPSGNELVKTTTSFFFVYRQMSRKAASEFCQLKSYSPTAKSGELADSKVLQNFKSTIVTALTRLNGTNVPWMIYTEHQELKYPQDSENLKLIGGKNIFEGAVLLNNRQVCKYGWDINEARVVCREFGLLAQESVMASTFSVKSVRPEYGFFKCHGFESNLASCMKDKMYISCDDAGGVKCYSEGQRPEFTVENGIFVFNTHETDDRSWFVCQTDEGEEEIAAVPTG